MHKRQKYISICTISLLLLAPMICQGQKFYVNTNCDPCNAAITKKLNKLGYVTTEDSVSAAYFIWGVFSKNRSYISFKVKHQESGYLVFRTSSGTVVDSTRSQNGNAAALNGFNASADVVRKILKKDFYAVVKNLPK